MQEIDSVHEESVAWHNPGRAMGVQVFNACVAFVVSLLSGYLGIGGGIVMAPLLLYLPPLLGLGPLTVQEVTGLTMAQALLACLAGAVMHGRHGFLDRRLVAWLGAGLIPASLAGSLLSSHVPGRALQGTLAALALLAAGLISRPMPEEGEASPSSRVPFRGLPALLLASAIGFACGMVGQGGSFILIPSMIALLRVPTRTAVGSNLALVFLSSVAGFAGKLATGQVTLPLALVIALGAVPGAVLGSRWSHRTPSRSLRLALCVLVAAVGVVLAIGVVWPARI